MLKGWTQHVLSFQSAYRQTRYFISCCVHVAILYVTMHNRMKVARRTSEIPIILLTYVFSVGFISLRLFNEQLLVHEVPQAPVFCHERVHLMIYIHVLIRTHRSQKHPFSPSDGWGQPPLSLNKPYCWGSLSPRMKLDIFCLLSCNLENNGN